MELKKANYKHLSTVQTGLQGIPIGGIDSIGAGKGKVGDMGVYGMGASELKAWLGDKKFTITNITLKQGQEMIYDSVVITIDSGDQGCFSFEVNYIDTEEGCKFSRGEGLEIGTCREVKLALPKGLAVSAKVLLKCFKTRHIFSTFLRISKEGNQVDPTKFGAYRAVKMLMEHCSNQRGITTEDKDALRKGLTELADSWLLLEPSDLNRFLPERATLISIDLMERPVDSLAKFKIKPPGNLLMHFLVVLKFEGELSIVVEKNKRRCFGMNVGIRRLVGLEKITPRTSIKLIGVEVQVRKLEELMKTLDTEYSLWSSNCWEFASAFAVAVVKLLIDNVAANSADKDRLDHGLENLMRVERPTPYMCFRYFANPEVLDDENKETLRRLWNRLEDQLKHSPDEHLDKKMLTVYYWSSMMYFFPPDLSESMEFIRMC